MKYTVKVHTFSYARTDTAAQVKVSYEAALSVIEADNGTLLQSIAILDGGTVIVVTMIYNKIVIN